MSRDPLGSTNRVRYTRSKDEKLNGLPAVADLSETIDDRINALLVAGTGITLTYSDATNSLTIDAETGGSGSIADDAVTNAKLANVATGTIKGRTTAGTGDPEDLTASQVRTLLNVADGATANATNAELRDRSTHTGTQGAETITGLATVATSGAYSDLTGTPTIPGTNYYGHGASMVPATGLFIGNGIGATALGTQAQVANRTVISPWIPARSISIDQLGCSISTLLASSNVKLVVYDSDSNGRPTTILRETANIDSSTNGTKFASITSLALTAGKVYWLGLRSSGTQTVRTLGVGAAPILSHTNAATPVIQSSLILTETFGNAAANWTYASSQHSNALVPLILMRVA